MKIVPLIPKRPGKHYVTFDWWKSAHLSLGHDLVKFVRPFLSFGTFMFLFATEVEMTYVGPVVYKIWPKSLGGKNEKSAKHSIVLLGIELLLY